MLACLIALDGHEDWSHEFQQGEDEDCLVASPMVRPVEAALCLVNRCLLLCILFLDPGSFM
jgi:hypothetical protein